MPIEVLLAPVGAGKTDYALRRLIQLQQEQSMAQVWVLVSGSQQETAFRQRLVDRSTGPDVHFNIEFFSFYQLYRRLLNMAHQPPYMLGDAARFGLLQGILSDLKVQGALHVFGEIALLPGFIQLVGDFIYELKQNMVLPENYLVAAQTPKDEDLALIYARYQRQLQAHRLVDWDGEGWLALDVLRQTQQGRTIGYDVDLLLVDGYDQFTPLQTNLLLLLAERVKQSLITLSHLPDRTATVGRRFNDTLNELKAAHAAQGGHVTLDIIAATDLGGLKRPAGLAHLMRQMFVADAQPQPAGDAITLIEAPDPVQESRALIRQVKRLLLAQDAQPDDVMIAVRDWSRYAGALAVAGREYGVPLLLQEGDVLDQNPAIRALLDLLALHENDFPRRALLDTLRSPYFAVPGISLMAIEQLTAISQRSMITGGRQRWLEAVLQAHQALLREDEVAALPVVATQEEGAALARQLSRFFVAVTPPEQATLAQYVTWLSDLIGPDIDDPEDDPGTADSAYGLRMPWQLRQQPLPGIEDRDRAALNRLVQVLRGLLSAEKLLGMLRPEHPMDRQTFLLQLRTAIAGARVTCTMGRNGRVLVTSVADARGLPHRHVLMPGLAEGVFPMPPGEDALYLDSERIALTERGVRLNTLAQRSADEGLFYEVIGAARETLTLSRPTIQDGAPWLASHLWRAVTAVLSDVEVITQRIRPGAVVMLEDAASGDEALLAVAQTLEQTTPPPGFAPLYQWVTGAYALVWQHVVQMRQLELFRASRHVGHDRFTGRLQHPPLIAHVASVLGPGRLWSASQLNDYGVCGFRFFARRLLHLDAWEEPDEGLDAAKLGTINHEILERTYRKVAARKLTIEPGNLDEALAILAEVAPQVLDAAPDALGFAADGLWQQERAVLVRRLEALLARDFSDDSPVSKVLPGARTPYLLEAGFRRVNGDAVAIPVMVNSQPESLYVQGFIDRMDRVGNQVVIIDYKTGSSEIPVSDMADGRNFQMLVYLRAGALLLGHVAPEMTLAGGMFWHLRNRKISGDVQLSNPQHTVALAEAEAHIGAYIAAGRQGDFTVQPRKLNHGRCVHYCEFAQLCRVSSTSQYKPESEA